jgi:hypothetical protein
MTVDAREVAVRNSPLVGNRVRCRPNVFMIEQVEYTEAPDVYLRCRNHQLQKSLG